MRDLSREAISKVQKAEEEAAAIRAEAEANARAKIEENEQRCAKEAADRVETTAKELKKKLEDVRRKTDELIVLCSDEAQEDADALEAVAEEKMREAVRVIVWEMLDSCQ